ncbi:MAG: DEAD/DEAH box helicase, partial [Desulfurococcales archaeon]|nr:DEAD/DEAH box helicase [Desulfurococcales archaeon]
RFTAELLEALGYERLYPPQEQAIEEGVEHGNSVVVFSPTASGKTLIALIAIYNSLRRDGGRAFYVAPLRSIAVEKYSSFKVLEDLGLSVGIVIGDLEEGPGDADVVVSTYEKLDSMIRGRVIDYNELRVLVVDEVHYVGDPKRGPVLETLIARLKSLGYKDSVQLVALSATVPNAEEIAEWLEARLVYSDWRPVPLREGVFKGYKLLFADGEERRVRNVTGVPSIDLAIDSSLEDGQTLVFSQSRRRASSLALRASEASQHLAYDKSLAGRYADLILETDGPRALREELSRLIRRGVCYHHAGLSSRQRKIIEEAFRRRAISAIFATPTLAAGVNLPARRVVIDEYYRFESGYRRPISVSEYKQMAGRAGRPSLDPYGEAVIVAAGLDDERTLMREYVLAELESVTSRLYGLRRLRHAILGLVSGQVSDKRQLVRVLENTLYYIQNPMQALSGMVETALKDLSEWGLVDVSDGRLEATRLGFEVSRLYVDPESVKILRELTLKIRSPGELELLYIISSVPDTPKLPVTRREEEALLDRIIEEAPELLDLFEWMGPEESRRVKMTFLLHDWINEASEQSLWERYGVGPGDLASIVDTVTWVSVSLSIIAREMGLPVAYVEEYRLLEKRLRHGVKKELIPLVSIPGVGRVRARRLYEAGFKTLEDLREATEEELEKIPGIGRETARSIIRRVKGAHRGDGEAAERERAERGLDRFLG